ncbi:cellular tumor antigen p53-like isoform X2 [Gallus gallus]|uniref:cellular tumor antigen p53-like isoform X2 n=1 Tax=Gallus gallus TaxID=9031 RepID=UPI001AE94C5F|nr:cellular tumor antigen p53-like isoform X2 [Gallus gallus]
MAARRQRGARREARGFPNAWTNGGGGGGERRGAPPGDPPNMAEEMEPLLEPTEVFMDLWSMLPYSMQQLPLPEDHSNWELSPLEPSDPPPPTTTTTSAIGRRRPPPI